MIDWNDNISDEMLAAYIDGNASPMEASMIEDSLQQDDLLSEAIDVVNDSLGMSDSLFNGNDMMDNSLNSIFEDWFPSIDDALDSMPSMPDIFNNALGDNDGSSPTYPDSDLLINADGTDFF